MKSQIAAVLISNGPMPFRYGQATQCHGEVHPNVPNNDCAVEIVQGEYPICMECTPTGNTEWYIPSSDKGIYCADPAVATNPANDHPARVATSYYYNGMHTACEASQYESGGACLPCHASCGSCTAGTDADCLTCVDNTLVPDGSPGTCNVGCDTTNGFYVDGGECMACSGECAGELSCPTNQCGFTPNCYLTCSSCNTNSFDDCLTCGDGATYNSTALTCTPNTCDTNNGFYYTFNTKVCNGCGTDCQTCVDNTQCETCMFPDYIVDPNNIQNCIPCDVNNEKFVNTAFTPAICDDCTPGCKTCSSTTECTSCSDPTEVPDPLDLTQCILCDTSQPKFINTANTPQSCDDCSEYCQACTDLATCTSCDTSIAVLNGGVCEICDQANGLIITGPTSCESCGVPNCLTCSAVGVCTSCDTSIAVLNGNDCQICDQANGFVITGPTSCESCGVANCLTCSSVGVCTSCETVNHALVSDSQCEYCDPVGNYIAPNGDYFTCESCGVGCLACDDSSTCTQCDEANSYFMLPNATCVQCLEADSKFFEGPEVGCLDCDESCMACSVIAHNCTQCQENVEHIFNEDSQLGSCRTTKEGCDSSCIECSGPGIYQCLSCPLASCLNINGQCQECPSPPVASENQTILEQATLTWTIKQTRINDASHFFLDFSEDDVYFLEPINMTKLKDHIEVS